MKKSMGLIVLAAMTTTGAMAADFTPYVGLGIVIDKAGTSAKRMGFDPTSDEVFVTNGGGKMKFDAVMAGEVTAGVKYGNVRGEFEFALRGASEDDYELYAGDLRAMMPDMGMPIPMPIMGNIDTSTSVKHNSYMFNAYYDFEISGSKWSPYVGAGIGVGTYKQKAKVEINLDNDMIKQMISAIGEDISTIRVTQDKTEFEWQLAVGTTYHFTPNWAADVAYRFNSSTIDGEFVYAHELKLGARYSF